MNRLLDAMSVGALTVAVLAVMHHAPGLALVALAISLAAMRLVLYVAALAGAR